MLSDKDHLAIQKATVYDLITLFEQEPDKEYTVEEIKKLMRAYIAGAEQ